MKKIITISLVCAIALSICTISSVTEAKTSSISKKSVVLEKGEKVKLKVKNSKKKVKWSSADKKVAKVSKKGKVTAVSAGTTKIKAKAGKKKMTCKVTVTEPVVYNNDVFTESTYKQIKYIRSSSLFGKKKITTADGISEIYAVLAGAEGFNDITSENPTAKSGGTSLEIGLKDGTEEFINLAGPIYFKGKWYEIDTNLATTVGDLLRKYLS